ncbi:unnamed protein product [Ambrosiozyma monospora]|uniref:Unnamed protein product n=1 Tax=Ambrosiozyma monospora TaxID=43982 RepID=A0ACB5T0D6_AMBMO|nr:unnamed protein product [Ambrosiozyma monospora]
MGYLKADGILDLLCESDGSLLYSLDITKLFSSEIRTIHDSILQTSSVLYIGAIDDLRAIRHFRNQVDSSQNESFFKSPDGSKKFNKFRRILIDFDLRIDLEDWFVTLSSFTKLEFAGNSILQQTTRIVKQAKFMILEARLNNSNGSAGEKLYAEVCMWGAPWYRTGVADVNSTGCAFFGTTLDMDLPSSCQYFKVLVKSSGHNDLYNMGKQPDEIIGTAFINPDILNSPQFMKKIDIQTDTSVVGQLVINLDLDESHVLPFGSYRLFEKMLGKFSIEKLIKFIQPSLKSSDIEPMAIMLLNIYLTLYKENEYLESLMKIELTPFDSHVRNNRVTSSKSSSSNIINTLFRGSSLLSKALENYSTRVGHEYLEKVLGELISQVIEENLDCECNPKLAPNTYKENYNNLLRYLNMLWDKIFKTSNDIPEELKTQWTNLRLQVEKVVDPNNPEQQVSPFRSVCSFVFLRFFSPPLLNPKMFNLTKSHLTDRAANTLKYLSKVLQTFANRNQYQPHKEPYLMGFNDDFLKKHDQELLLYIDRLTGRKMDFNEKILEMSNLVERLSLTASNEILNELPTMPYLIDKYLNIYKLVALLDGKNQQSSRESVEINNRTRNMTNMKFDFLEFDDTDFGSNEFIKNFMDREGAGDFHDMMMDKEGITIESLLDESSKLVKKHKKMDKTLHKPEIPTMFSMESMSVFVDTVLKTLQLTDDYYIVYDQANLADPIAMAKAGYDSNFEEFIRTLIRKNDLSRTASIQSILASNDHSSSSSGSGKPGVFKKLFGRRRGGSVG